MKRIWLTMLETAVKALVGAFNYERVRDVVMDVDQSKLLTGEQKHQYVITELKNVAYVVGTALLNLAIETVVIRLKAMK